ncbi:hypothetical protein CAPTEDRAFT_159099 [Capitella teleta]|uniref:Gfo/Idh/MocA-like oxidoreductase N-terminal domain-containing protein n=1 Tax=Capitella teleta TaxID=283909 RepID=R7TXW2_CAPTE|nr:hypothetical protein CAPTEDRAFT_159099 [Capitella teleta]|eukprot:ELT98452.1 hypothetical protein CAPTEDRAFT_159099 [Capitella teleta]
MAGIAIFGMGRAGLIHFKNAISNPRIRLHYVVDMDTSKAKDIVDVYNLGEAVKVLSPDDAAVVFVDERVNSVIICTPTFAHEEIVLKALQNGRAVFCEKPISENAEGIRAAYDVASKAGKPLLCSFNRRFDPSVSSLREKVKAGGIGQVYSIRTCSRDNPVPSMEYLKISGGIFHDCAVHDIDMACWILGQYPCSVYTMAHAHDKDIAAMGDVDTVAIVMKYPSGAIVTIELSRHALYGYDQRLEVFGSEGMLISENQRPNELQHHSVTGCQSLPMKYSFPQRYAESYIAALDHFVDIIEGKCSVEVTKDETLNVSRIASACEESLKTGKAISLSFS